jgi:tetratricopeptide (TPR) repeat protein
MKIHYCLLAAVAIFTTACNSTSKEKELIRGLEQRLALEFTNERSDSLVTIYRELVKNNPEDHANNLQYLTRAAEVQMMRKDNAAPAARWLNDAVGKHAEGQDLAQTIGLYARLYNMTQYKSASTYHLASKDITYMQNHLRGNTRWIDSALVRIDRKMNVGGIVSDKALARQFIEIAEGYAAITSSEDQYAELLTKAGGLAKTIEEYNKAIVLYHRLSERLPEHPKARTALFMQGFIYENDLNNLPKAKETYEAFLQKYPDDADYADDVKVALQMLGKAPEDIIKNFGK